MAKRITFSQTQSGISTGIIDADKTVGLLMYNDKLPSNWMPSVSAWVTATDYIVGDKVYDAVSANYYVSNAVHTAGASFATDVANWDVDTNTVRTFTNLIEVESAGLTSTDANFKLEHYQAKEVYRMNENAILSIYIVAKTANTFNFAELYEFQKQLPIGEKASAFGIWGDFPMTPGKLTEVQTQLDKIYAELEIKTAASYISGNYDSYTDVASLIAVDNSTAAAQEVFEVVTQDGDAAGFALQTTNLGNVGATLGIHSLSEISDSIGSYEFNVAFGNYEMRNPILTFGGIKIKDLTNVEKKAINDSKHGFVTNFATEAGYRFYSDKTATINANDYNQVNRNRVWTRIERDLTLALNPLVNEKFRILNDGSGRLEDIEIDRINDIVELPLAVLEVNGDVSSFNYKVKNTANFATTRELDIVVEVVPTIINETITVSLGFTLQ